MTTLCETCVRYDLTRRRCPHVDRGLTPTIAARGGELAKGRTRHPWNAGRDTDKCPRYLTRGAQ